jgi:hypothetical protein
VQTEIPIRNDWRDNSILPSHIPPFLSPGDAKLKITVAAEGGTVLIPDPEVTTFRPCSAMDDFVIIGGY